MQEGVTFQMWRPFLVLCTIADGRQDMRFIHIADVHLGAQPDAGPLYSERRPRELWDTFEHVIRVCEEEQTDLLIIAGDLFHRQPLLRELKEVDHLFSGLSRTKVVLVAGNHDYIRRDSYYRTFQWSENVFPLFGETLEYVDFPELQTAVYGLSYHSREIREPLYDLAAAGGAEPIELLAAHGGDEKHIPIDRNKLSASGFDYIALGHIHKPQALEKNRIIYAGALEPVDRNDTGPHGYVRGEITAQGVRTQWIPCACREYIHLDLTVDRKDTETSVRQNVEKLLEDNGNENIYKITLRGKRDADISFHTKRIADIGNILEVIDETSPAYDMRRLYEENRENLLGQYIRCFDGCKEGSVEYEAWCEGVDALLGGR